MRFEREIIEIYGLILGDGHFRLQHKKYPNAVFYNTNLKLMRYLKGLIKTVSGKSVKIHYRLRIKHNSDEYSLYLPSDLSRKLYTLGFRKDRVPDWILKSKHDIYFLKSLYEAEGTKHHSQIEIYQNKYKLLLEDCVKIANRHGLAAHVHRYGKSRSDDQYYLAIENCKKIRRVFGRTVKHIPNKESGKGAHYIVRRKLLRILNSSPKGLKTSELVKHLSIEGIDIKKSYRGYSFLGGHLKPMQKENVVNRIKPKEIRDALGRVHPQESVWKLSKHLPDSYIINYPYGSK